MQTYILVDTANMFMRARHVVRGDDMYTKIGMSYHITVSYTHLTLPTILLV